MCDDIQAERTLYLTPEQVERLTESSFKQALKQCIAERNAMLRVNLSPAEQELHDLLAADAARTPQPDICPDEGSSGEFSMKMYRGTRYRRRCEFVFDPGDYGRGEYWAATRDFALTYSDLIVEGDIHLKNALRLAPDEVCRLARSSGATVLEDGRDKRLRASERFTAEMKAKGYDGIVVCGYETFHLWSACVFLSLGESIGC